MPMKSYDSFSEWKADQTKPAQALISPLKKIIKTANPKLKETVKWGQGSFLLNDLPICYIHAKKSSIQLGFYVGSKLKDPKDRLEGNGKFVRFITLASNEDFDPTYFKALIKTASKIIYR